MLLVRCRQASHTAGMDQRHDYTELDAHPPWLLRFLVRRALPVALGVGAIAVLIVGYMQSGQKQSDRHYTTYVSIARAEKLVKICDLKRGGMGNIPRS